MGSKIEDNGNEKQRGSGTRRKHQLSWPRGPCWRVRDLDVASNVAFKVHSRQSSVISDSCVYDKRFTPSTTTFVAVA